MVEHRQNKHLVTQKQNTLKRCTEVTAVILSATRDYASNNSTQILFK